MFVKSTRFKQVCQLLLSLIVAWASSHKGVMLYVLLLNGIYDKKNDNKNKKKIVNSTVA